MLKLENCYRVFKIHPDNGQMYHSEIGKYAILDNGTTLHIFADTKDGWIRRHIGQGQITPQIQKKIDSVKSSQYFAVVSEYELRNGYRPDLLPESDMGDSEGEIQPETSPDAEVNVDDKARARPPSIFDLYYLGRSKPSRLQMVDGSMVLNGKELSKEAQEALMKMLNSGAASVRYVKAPIDPQKLGKMESLMKAIVGEGDKPPSAGEFEPPDRALSWTMKNPAHSADQTESSLAQPVTSEDPYEFDNLFHSEDLKEDAAANAGFINNHWSKFEANNKHDPEHVDAMRQFVFGDSLTRGIGSKKSYLAFLDGLQRSKQRGSHIMIDGNDFGQINKDPEYGNAGGDAAITMYGKALRGAVDSLGEGKTTKLHRLGGDEFHVFVAEKPGETPAQHAQRVNAVYHTFRNNLEAAVPPKQFSGLNTKYKLSASVGAGKSPRAADVSLTRAKDMKRQANRPKGQAESHYHSMLESPVAPAPKLGPSA